MRTSRVLATFLLSGATFAFAGGADPSAAADFGRDGRTLYLRAATVDTRALPAADLNVVATAGGESHLVVQFAGPLTAVQRAALAARDVQLGAYLPQNAYIVDRASAAELAELDFVAWTGLYAPEWKLDPEVGAKLSAYQTPERIALEAAGKLRLSVTVFADADLDGLLQRLAAAGLTVDGREQIGAEPLLTLTVDRAQLGVLIRDEAVQYVEDAPEITFRNSTTRWIVQSNQTNVTPLYDNGLHGEGQVIGVLDSRLDVNHCSFSDSNPIGPTHRKIVAYNATLGSADHGTHVSGTAAGDGGATGDTRGIAYLARLAFNTTPSFNESASLARLELHHSQGARLHTNSWGDDGTTSYNSLCRGFDRFMYENEDSLALIAVTNTSSLRNPENAKNILACGASQDTPSQGNFCSGGAGPTSDGRRKPEVFAPGCSTQSSRWSTACSTIGFTGTSMATPAITGAGALIRQYFAAGYYPDGVATPGAGFEATGALVKAMLINSAVDMTGISGYPSNGEGWGRVLADNSVYFPGDARRLYVEDVRNADGLTTNDVTEFAFEVTGSAEPLQITLAWTEPPASSGASFAQVNDLDLEVVAPGGELFRGNVFVNGRSAEGGTRDDRNNVEQARVVNPAAGPWLVRVRGTAVNVGRQGFALVATGELNPVLVPFSISLPSGSPTQISPGDAVSFPVRITPLGENIVPGSPTLFYRSAAGPFANIPLALDSGDLYTATLPTVGCDDSPEFYIQAEGDGGAIRTLPAAAPASTLGALVGDTIGIFSDDFNSDLGWTVNNDAGLTAGAWQRGTPLGGGGRGDPATDFDGSGVCYVTDNRAGDSDVDGGATRLISPAIDLATGDATIRVAVWYTNNAGGSPNADTFVISISNNNGSSWTTVQTLGPVTSAGWQEIEFAVSAFVTPTANVRVRFEASDFGSGSVVEAGVDAFSVERFECSNPFLAGDLNCDGQVSLSDISAFVLALTDPNGYAATFPDCDAGLADLNGDSAVTVSDIAPFVALLTGG